MLSAHHSLPGANSVYSSLIVLLTIASLLNKQRDQIANVPDKKLSNVLYALFDGESLGYIGSGSSLYYNNFQVYSLLMYIFKKKLI